MRIPINAFMALQPLRLVRQFVRPGGRPLRTLASAQHVIPITNTSVEGQHANAWGVGESANLVSEELIVLAPPEQCQGRGNLQDYTASGDTEAIEISCVGTSPGAAMTSFATSSPAVISGRDGAPKSHGKS